MPDIYDCIVIGAGIAGVTAARDVLASDRSRSVLLLEATDRIGGRIRTNTEFFDGSPVEEGADWVHVSKSKYPEFYKELKENDFGVLRFEKTTANMLGFPTPTSTQPAWIPPRTTIDSVLTDSHLMKIGRGKSSLENQIGRLRFPAGRDIPAGRFVNALGYQGRAVDLARYALSGHTPGQLDPDDSALDDISMAGFLSDNLSVQLFKVMSEYELRRRGNLEEPIGYDNLPAKISKKFDDDGGTIRPNSPVASIARAPQDNLVEIRLGTGESLLARSAVVTTSVGVLKEVSDFIDPSLLSAEKRAALDIVRMGNIVKLGVQFRMPFWQQARNTLRPPSVISHPTGAALHETRSFFAAFPNATNPPFVLAGLLMGPDLQAGSFDDPIVVARDFVATLNKLYDDDWQTEPWQFDDVVVHQNGTPRVHMTNWANERYFLGGNSYIGYVPGQSVADAQSARFRLMDPRQSIPLFWAGEATSSAYDPKYQPLSVHGAWRSGCCVAEDIDYFLRSNRDAGAFRNYFDAKYLSGSEPGLYPTSSLNRLRELADSHFDGNIDDAIDAMISAHEMLSEETDDD